MKVKIFIAVFVAVIIGISVYLTYNKPHRNPEAEQAIALSAVDLFHQFETNEDSANMLYLDKVLIVPGRIKNITVNQENIPVVTLETGDPVFGIRCTMKDVEINLHTNESVSIKGICTGFLSDVILTNASVDVSKN